MRPRPAALLLAYDGAPFKGWQAQPGKPTVQAAVERALALALGVEAQVHGAARTDAGVHAEGQVCHLVKERLAAPGALEALRVDLPGLLPASVRLRAAAMAHESFHARSSAIGKRYAYRFAWGPREAAGPLLGAPPEALEARAFWLGSQARPRWELARAALQGLDGLPALPGLSSPSKDKRPAPPLDAWALSETAGAEGAGTALLELRGAAFRKHQVRNLAGHLAAVALGLAAPETLRALAQRRRPWMGATAPPAGLTLVEVLYAPELDPFR